MLPDNHHDSMIALPPYPAPQSARRSRVDLLTRVRVAALALTLPFLLLVAAPSGRAAEPGPEADLFAALAAGNHIAMMRHALAPGTGDPDNFRLGDCSTQRNLSGAGRRQAAAIGRRLKSGGVDAAEVYTSQWCRCVETARLLDFGEPVELAPLNSFFRDFARREEQTEQLRTWLSARDLQRPLVLVTHQVNITAFTGVFPQSGEIVVIRRTARGTFEVAGTIRTDPS